MSKFESDIRKELKKIHDEAATKVRKLLKSKKALLIYNNYWDQPGHNEFRKLAIISSLVVSPRVLIVLTLMILSMILWHFV